MGTCNARILETTVAHSRYDPASDQHLVLSIQRGDTDAFRQLYTRFYHRLLEFACGIVRTRESARDIVQDVFAHIWERRETWEVRERLDVYLYQAVRYRSLHVVRHERIVDRVRTTNHPDIRERVGLRADTLTPEETLDLEELQLLLARAVHDLPAAQREAILLHWRHGLSNAEVARVMGKSTGAIAVYISRARERLRVVLDREIAPDR